MLEKDVTICNQLGLHARASAKLVSLAERYHSEVVLTKIDDGLRANAKSIMGLMMLAATCGTEIRLSADDGDDAAEALEAVYQLIRDKFDEDN